MGRRVGGHSAHRFTADLSRAANVQRMTVSYRFPGAIVTEREHTVPLDHGHPKAARITVFTRELAAPGGEERPYLVFLQGGPGFEAARPTSPPSGWMKRALEEYRVLLLDQRGTGRSTPVGAQIPGDTAQAQADYLKHFRADSIVRDAELIRQELGVDRWSILGQSFGGFTSVAYLSIAPQGLREAMLTGGFTPVGRPVDDIYTATWQRAIQKNQEYFERYPEDRATAQRIFDRLDADDVRLPDGDRLTARRFRQLGMWLGASDGFEKLHHVLELPFGSNAFLHDAEAGASSWERNPLYATLHESSYADGVATRWSGARAMPAEVVEQRYFTAEHIFPWMWEDYAGLRPHHEAAEILAQYEWPKLYDAAQLASNEVPVAGTAYLNDLYVESAFAQETARLIRGCKVWVTNEYEHNGLRFGDVLGRLIDLVKGRA